MSEQTVPVIGFVGLGVMGGPMCRNIALKHSGDVIAFDMNSAAFAALDGTKARRAQTLGEVAEQADLVFLSLPGAQQVEQVCLGSRGLASVSHPPSVIVDLSTTTVAVARGVAERLSSKGIAFADAPVARTREAAQRGELSIMVGADEALYARIEPLLRCQRRTGARQPEHKHWPVCGTLQQFGMFLQVVLYAQAIGQRIDDVRFKTPASILGEVCLGVECVDEFVQAGQNAGVTQVAEACVPLGCRNECWYIHL